MTLVPHNYGSCRYRERFEFWEELAGLFGLFGSLELGRDFNVVRFPSKMLGGEGRRATRSMRDFDNFINETGLRDVNINIDSYSPRGGRIYFRV